MNSKSQKQIFSIRLSLLLIVLSTIIIPLVLAVPLFVAKVMGWPLPQNIGLDSSNFFLFFLVVESLGLAITFGVVAKKIKGTKTKWSAVGLSRFPVGKSLLYIIGYYLAVFIPLFILIAIAAALGVEPPSDQAGQTKKALLGGFWPAFFLTCILAPIIEEILFRGMLFKALSRKYSIPISVLLSTIVFTVVHLDPVTAISVIPLGAYLCFMYIRLGSIIPGMVLHSSWNFLVLVAKG